VYPTGRLGGSAKLESEVWTNGRGGMVKRSDVEGGRGGNIQRKEPKPPQNNNVSPDAVSCARSHSSKGGVRKEERWERGTDTEGLEGGE